MQKKHADMKQLKGGSKKSFSSCKAILAAMFNIRSYGVDFVREEKRTHSGYIALHGIFTWKYAIY